MIAMCPISFLIIDGINGTTVLITPLTLVSITLLSSVGSPLCNLSTNPYPAFAITRSIFDILDRKSSMDSLVAC